jgi:hypothetical protein
VGPHSRFRLPDAVRRGHGEGDGGLRIRTRPGVLLAAKERPKPCRSRRKRATTGRCVVPSTRSPEGPTKDFPGMEDAFLTARLLDAERESLRTGSVVRL